MNLLLFTEEDRVAGNSFRVTGSRLRHLLQVHGARVGDTLRAGLLGGQLGEARIDEAERIQAATSPEGASHLSGERIYALYPAHLDDEA